MSSGEVNEGLILKSWRDSRSLIKFKLRSPFIDAEVWTNVATIDEGRLELWVVGENAGTLDFNLLGAVLKYEDPREAHHSIRGDVESRVVCALSVLLADGSNFVLYEWRAGDDPE